MLSHIPLAAGAIVLALAGATPVVADPAQDAIELVNAARSSSGRKPLVISSELTKSAQKHADELVQRGYGTKLKSGGHTGKNGSGVRQRAGRAGFKACYIVENLGWGQTTAKIAVDEWMRSKLHKKNLLDRKVKQIGVGFSAPKTWVFVAAKEC